MESFSVTDLLLLPLILVSVSAHEFSHGWMASMLGDQTARDRGRLTLNPFKHLSWKFTLVLPILVYIATLGHFAFGFAKPVPINPLQLRSYRRNWQRPFADMIWVGLIGPAVNLVFVCLLTLLVFSGALADGDSGWALRKLVCFAILINLLYAMVNLLPLPPFDGSRLIIGLLPQRHAIRILRYELIMFVGIIAGLALVSVLAGGMDNVVLPLLRWAWRALGLSLGDFDRLLNGG
ncbi:MAG: site-2 protease family protein [Verrucomicrobia bacterium]|nr:site-2 protease family protein [Verrucomicrobiota bacterium]